MVRKGLLDDLGIMKKRYETPTVAQIGLEAEPMMNVASTETGGVGVGNKPVDGNSPDLSGSNSDVWGDLWSEL